MRRLLLILVVLLWPVTGWAAFSEDATMKVTKTCVGAFDTCTITFPNDITTGHFLVVAGGLWHNPAVTSYTVTGCGTTFAYLLGTSIDTGFKPLIAYGTAGSTGPCTLTVNGNNADDFGSFSADSFSVTGSNTVALDVDGGGSTGTSTTPADSLTTLTANALLIGAMTKANSSTITPGGSYTQIGEQESGANFPHSAEFRVATTATSYSVDWTTSASVLWSVQTGAFKEVVAVSGCTGGLLLRGAGGC